jgi:hypothetical protein
MNAWCLYNQKSDYNIHTLPAAGYCHELIRSFTSCFSKIHFNILATEFYIYILEHPVCKMWIIQEPKEVALWNKRQFEKKNGECAACLKYSVLIFVEKKYIYIKCNIWRVAVRPSYI